MRKMVAAILCIMMMVSVLAGCGSASAPDQTDTTVTTADTATGTSTNAATETQKKDITITVGASQNWVKDIDRALAEAFTAKTGIKIDFQVNPDDQYKNIIKTKLATNEAPDILYVNVGIALEDYQPEKYFMNLSDMAWVSKMKDWAIKGCSVNGKLYAYNIWSVEANGLLYNTQIFEKYKLTPPNNFNELKNVCKVLLENGIQPIYDNAKDIWHMHWWPAQLAVEIEKDQPGITEKLNKNEAKLSDSKALLQGMKDYKELYDLGYMGKNALANEWVPGYQAMGTGKAAMINTYSTYQNEVFQQFPESKADTWKMFPVTIGGCNSVALSAGGIARAVNANTKNKAEVEAYFNYLAEDENAKSFYTARTDLGEPAYKGIDVRPLSQGYTSLSTYSVNGRSTVLSNSVKYWSQDVIAKAMQDMLIGTLTPEEVLQTIDEDRIKSFNTAGK